ncbi:Helix-loop-helix DNA-binding domain protein [Necator americanus]|uniref:Helix-loop-helix DNA-binding domain protein n=1 Tax=Necator americanus TaxID=51031 RepID=W2T3V8_NECAM|nr:Helix-loop-helix DNA-binding domain protein [Necator americanus]ETN76588.1 Helix-loop-helix DNA-binding domain protein [Necator americanus]
MIADTFTVKDRFTIQRQINPQYDESSDAERRSEPKRWHKQPTIVAKRNARERTRVHTVNQAFVTLKFHLPSLRTHTKRVSKLKILNAAIRYIDSLVDLLKTCDTNAPLTVFPTERRHSTASADRSLIRHQPIPYMQTLFDYPYLYPQNPNTQNFMMNPSTSFLLPPCYTQ